MSPMSSEPDVALKVGSLASEALLFETLESLSDTLPVTRPVIRPPMLKTFKTPIPISSNLKTELLLVFRAPEEELEFVFVRL